MNVIRIVFRSACWVVGGLALVACVSKEPGFYRHSPSIVPLEVPPDLTKPDFQDNFEIPQIGALLAKDLLLSDGSKVKLQQDGRLRWMTISAEPTIVWEYMRDFWNSKQVPLSWQTPSIGLMETEWVKSYDSRFAKDRFRVRIEPGKEKNTSNVYVIHRGIQQAEGDVEPVPVWTDRLSDPELEIEVIGQMLEFFALEPKRKQQLIEQAKQQKADSVLKLNDVPPALVVNDKQDRVWDFAMLAIERMGHRVESRDKASGLMKVIAAPAGDGVGMALFQREERFTLSLQKEGDNATRITLQADKGPFADLQNMRNFLIRLKENL